MVFGLRLMKPFVTLAEARTPDGAELTLHGHDGHFYLRVNRQPLMGTNACESEKALADLACDGLEVKRAPKVLIGGLGFGFTLRRVLERVGKGAVVQVAELLPEVVAWNREFLSEVNGDLLKDARVKVIVGDVFKVISQAKPGYYDAIMLDVDNGPIAMVQDGNSRLYQTQGFEAISRALAPDGRVAFWSASPDRGFARELGKAGFAVEVFGCKAYAQARRNSHTIFVADRKPPTAREREREREKERVRESELEKTRKRK